jgi:uncharacterized protein
MTGRPLAVATGLLLSLIPLHAAAHAASGSVSSALPHGAHVTVQKAIPGYAHDTAVEFTRGGSTDVAVVATSGSQASIRWQDRLPTGKWTLSVPGPQGLFRGLNPSGVTKYVFAFTFTGSAVDSAIAGSDTGLTGGDIKASLGAHGFTVVTTDTAHKGSVAYKWNTRYAWSGTQYAVALTRHLPNYAPDAAPRPNVTIRTADGSESLISLQVADTEAERETGLMYITSLDPDSGMIFVWPNATTTSGFWMENTYVPLSIAFADAGGTIIDIQDMAALDTTVHYAPAPYRYAIEVNQGYFAEHDIKVGDKLKLHPPE